MCVKNVGGTCSNGIEGVDNNGAACCSLSCGTCGGRGCGSRPGGSSECCRGRIKASGVYCDDSGAAPCIIGSEPGELEVRRLRPGFAVKSRLSNSKPYLLSAFGSFFLSCATGQTCSNGIEGIDANGVVCCPLSCGACAGAGCADRPGGASDCCGGTIKALGVMCSESGTAPCVI